MAVFPDIMLRKEFAGFQSDPYFRAILYLFGKDHEFKTHYLANEASNILKYKQLCKISSLLKDHGISKFMPVKGMYLLNTLFSDSFGIRNMADIDILVHPDEFKKLPRFLRKHPEMKLKSNFHPFLRRFFGEDFAITYNETVIELHSNIALIQFREFMKEVFENIQIISTPDKNDFSVPQIEYAAMIMLIHDYTRDDFIDLTFRRLIEFYIVISNCDFEKLKNIAKKHGLDTMLDCHLFMIWTIIEKPNFSRYDFKIIEEFGLIEKAENEKQFCVNDKMALQRVLYGKRWKYLRLRNLSAELFKRVFGRKRTFLSSQE